MSTYVPTDKVNIFYVTTSATPTVPIKVVENQSNKKADQPLVVGKGLTTVTVAITSSENSREKKLLRVLLDSGSDGDLLFLKEGTPSMFPYKKRIWPQNGVPLAARSKLRSWVRWISNFQSSHRPK